MFRQEQDWQRVMLEEERKLLKEVATQRLSWDKVGNIVKLNALMRAHQRNWQDYR